MNNKNSNTSNVKLKKKCSEDWTKARVGLVFLFSFSLFVLFFQGFSFCFVHVRSVSVQRTSNTTFDWKQLRKILLLYESQKCFVFLNLMLFAEWLMRRLRKLPFIPFFSLSVSFLLSFLFCQVLCRKCQRRYRLKANANHTKNRRSKKISRNSCHCSWIKLDFLSLSTTGLSGDCI